MSTKIYIIYPYTKMISVFITLIIMHVLDLKLPLRCTVETKKYRRFNSHDKKKYLIVCITNNNNNNNNDLFLFTQAPPRIKSFISACYSMTQSIGNLVVVVVSALSFHKQVRLLYSILSTMTIFSRTCPHPHPFSFFNFF